MIGTLERSLRELDYALGPRISAMVLSGSIIPPSQGVRNQEGPQFLTSRVLVIPMLKTLGYTDVTDTRRELKHTPGLVIATTAANHPLSESVKNLLMTMRHEGIPVGIATDGIRWMLAETEEAKPKIVCMSDLRPYYLEVLDRDRFKTSVEEDRGNLRLFSNLFSKG